MNQIPVFVQAFSSISFSADAGPVLRAIQRDYRPENVNEIRKKYLLGVLLGAGLNLLNSLRERSAGQFRRHQNQSQGHVWHGVRAGEPSQRQCFGARKIRTCSAKSVHCADRSWRRRRSRPANRAGQRRSRPEPTSPRRCRTSATKSGSAPREKPQRRNRDLRRINKPLDDGGRGLSLEGGAIAMQNLIYRNSSAFIFSADVWTEGRSLRRIPANPLQRRSFKWVECCAYRQFSTIPWRNRRLQRSLQFWHARLHLHIRS